MARKRTIVGIGEALLAELPGNSSAIPAGLAVEVAHAVAQLNHRGMPISRVGQDAYATELLSQLAAVENIDLTHMQSDPDLPTGRLVVRAIAGKRTTMLDQRAAFDNLQWDFDLMDVAKDTEAAIFGMVAQRGGQSRSVITRFLSEATGSIIVVDLTNRLETSFDRATAFKSLEVSHLAVVDAAVVSLLRLSAGDGAPQEIAQRLLRDYELSGVIWHDANEPLKLIGHSEAARTSRNVSLEDRHLVIAALLIAMLDGESTSQAIDAATAALVRKSTGSS